MRVYSPSQTEEWLRDPLVRYLRYKEHLYPATIGRNELAGMIGTGVASGMALYHHTGDTLGPPIVASEEVLLELHHHLAHGRTLGPGTEDAATTIPLQAAGTVERAMANNPIPASWKVLHVEHTLPDHGYCRIDLGMDTPEGPVVIDYKCKMNVDDRRLPFQLQEWEYSWQFLHYAWAYGEFLGKKIRRAYVRVLPVTQPRHAPIMHPFVIDDEIMALWLKSATRVWGLMEQEDAGLTEPWWTFKVSTQYGRDPYADAITVCKLEPDLIAHQYVKVPRRKRNEDRA